MYQHALYIRDNIRTGKKKSSVIDFIIFWTISSLWTQGKSDNCTHKGVLLELVCDVTLLKWAAIDDVGTYLCSLSFRLRSDPPPQSSPPRLWPPSCHLDNTKNCKRLNCHIFALFKKAKFVEKNCTADVCLWICIYFHIEFTCWVIVRNTIIIL